MSIHANFQGHTDIVNNLVFSAEESRKMISISQDRSMRVWDINTQRQLKSSTFTSTCWALDINKNDTNYATGHESGEVKIWSLSEMREV